MTDLDRLARTGRWHGRPLAEKALLSLGLLALALALPPWPGAALVLAAAVAATLGAARVPPADWLRAAWPALSFALLGAVVVAFSAPWQGIQLALRGSAAVACLLLLATTTPAADLIRGARRLGLPADLAEVALTTYRFLFLLGDSAREIHSTQAARLGYDGWRRSLRSLGLLVAALLPRALERARRLETGLAARGFDGGLPTLCAAPPASARGVAGSAAVLALVAGGALWLGR